MVSELFQGWEGRSKNVTLSSVPGPSRNRAGRQNGFTYRKRKLFDFGGIISLPNAENLAKCKHGGARLTTMFMDVTTNHYNHNVCRLVSNKSKQCLFAHNKRIMTEKFIILMT